MQIRGFLLSDFLYSYFVNTSWKIIFVLQKGTKANAQRANAELIRTALLHRYGNTRLGAIPISDAELTDAIFGINAQDKLDLDFEGPMKHITGQDLKELFIATILAKHLEERSKYPVGTGFFIVIPNTPGSCDVNILISKPDLVKNHYDTALRLTPDHEAYPLQIKESFDHERLAEKIMIPAEIDVARLDKLVGSYEELTIVYMRELLIVDSGRLDEFFKKHKNVILIAIPTGDGIPYTPKGSEEKPEKISLPDNKNNYMITFNTDTFAIVSFDKPSFLRPFP